MSDTSQHFRSPSSLVSIDGSKVKFIRESNGLTQLYISTTLGVTTDTVSRWENRKYPKVKWENVEKLAEALEVEVAEILDHHKEEEEKPPAAPEPPPVLQDDKAKKRFVALLSLVFSVLVASVIILSLTGKEAVKITATRFLPGHMPVGQTFPVVIKVESDCEQPFSFILQEKLPKNLVAVKGIPEIASIDRETNTVKWLCNAPKSPFYLAYLVQAAPNSKSDGKVVFKGQIKADNAPRFEQEISGESRTELSDFHWADANTDGMIDDEEILMVYSSAEVLSGLGIDMDRIRKIWSSGGYVWDPEKNNYQVVE